jgi:glutamate decarboxylase
MNFSKGGSMIIAQYYQFLRLGFSGYTRIMQNLESVAERLRKGIEDTGRSPTPALTSLDTPFWHINMPL